MQTFVKRLVFCMLLFSPALLLPAGNQIKAKRPSQDGGHTSQDGGKDTKYEVVNLTMLRERFTKSILLSQSIVSAKGEKSIVSAKGEKSLAAAKGEKSLAAEKGEKSIVAAKGGKSLAAEKGEKSIVAAKRVVSSIRVKKSMRVMPDGYICYDAVCEVRHRVRLRLIQRGNATLNDDWTD